MEGIQLARSTNWKSLVRSNWKTSGSDTRKPKKDATLAQTLTARALEPGIKSRIIRPARGVKRTMERIWSIGNRTAHHIPTADGMSESQHAKNDSAGLGGWRSIGGEGCREDHRAAAAEGAAGDFGARGAYQRDSRTARPAAGRGAGGGAGSECGAGGAGAGKARLGPPVQRLAGTAGSGKARHGGRVRNERGARGDPDGLRAKEAAYRGGEAAGDYDRGSGAGETGGGRKRRQADDADLDAVSGELPCAEGNCGLGSDRRGGADVSTEVVQTRGAARLDATPRDVRGNDTVHRDPHGGPDAVDERERAGGNGVSRRARRISQVRGNGEYHVNHLSPGQWRDGGTSHGLSATRDIAQLGRRQTAAGGNARRGGISGGDGSDAGDRQAWPANSD